VDPLAGKNIDDKTISNSKGKKLEKKEESQKIKALTRIP